MTDEKKVPEVKFMPGCFDDFDGTQAELDQLMKLIQDMALSGELMENAIALTDEVGNFADVGVRNGDLTDEEADAIMSRASELYGNIRPNGESLH